MCRLFPFFNFSYYSGCTCLFFLFPFQLNTKLSALFCRDLCNFVEDFLSTSVNNGLSVYLKSPVGKVINKVVFPISLISILCNILQYHFDGLDYLKFEPVTFVSILRAD